MMLITKKITGLAFAVTLTLLFSLSLSAAEQVEREIAVVLNLGDKVGVLDLDFLPSELAEGESRTVTNSAGETMQMSKRGGEVVITSADGSETVLPPMPGPREGNVWVEEDAGEMNVKVEVEMATGEGSDGLFISSGKPLDEATRETIRTALKAAGITREIVFMEPGMHKVFIHEDSQEGPEGEIRMIKKIQVIQESEK